MLDCLKAGNRAAAVAEMARKAGEAPEGKTISIQVVRPDGQVDKQPVRYEELVAEAGRLAPLIPQCARCPANVLRRPFGCIGAINYPIPKVVEEWLACMLQPSTAIGGKLFLDSIREFGYTGQPIQKFREAGMFESDQPIKKKVKGGLFSSTSVTTSQLFEALFCINDPLDPNHCLGVLLWLGSIRLDGAPVETPEQAMATFRLGTPEEREQRTELVTEGDLSVDGIEQFDWFLRALYQTWVLNKPLWVSA